MTILAMMITMLFQPPVLVTASNNNINGGDDDFYYAFDTHDPDSMPEDCCFSGMIAFCL
jgi:hypothetical protein